MVEPLATWGFLQKKEQKEQTEADYHIIWIIFEQIQRNDRTGGLI